MWVQELSASRDVVGDLGTGAWSTPGVTSQGNYDIYDIYYRKSVLPSALTFFSCQHMAQHSSAAGAGGKMLPAHISRQDPGENPPFLVGSGGCDAEDFGQNPHNWPLMPPSLMGMEKAPGLGWGSHDGT